MGGVTAALLFGLPAEPYAVGALGVVSAVILGLLCIAVAVSFWNRPLAVRASTEDHLESRHYLGRPQCVAYFGAGLTLCALAYIYLLT